MVDTNFIAKQLEKRAGTSSPSYKNERLNILVVEDSNSVRLKIIEKDGSTTENHLGMLIRIKKSTDNLLDRLLRNENFFKFKAKNRFNHRHIDHIPRIKYFRYRWQPRGE